MTHSSSSQFTNTFLTHCSWLRVLPSRTPSELGCWSARIHDLARTFPLHWSLPFLPAKDPNSERFNFSCLHWQMVWQWKASSRETTHTSNSAFGHLAGLAAWGVIFVSFWSASWSERGTPEAQVYAVLLRRTRGKLSILRAFSLDDTHCPTTLHSLGTTMP